MTNEQALVAGLRREAALDRPVAPHSIDAAVMRALSAAEPAPAAKPRSNVIRFMPAVGFAAAACLVVAATVAGLRMKMHTEKVREMEALVADVSSAAAFFARAVEPVTHGIRI